jgi:hypothetical protein
MGQITFIDSNCMIGRRAFREPGAITKTEEFLRELEYHQIAGALVHHVFSVELDPSYGNEALMAECAHSPRLFPCWVLLPHHVGEMPPPEQLVSQMKSRNVRAARIFPRMHGFSLDALKSSGLLDCSRASWILPMRLLRTTRGISGRFQRSLSVAGTTPS